MHGAPWSQLVCFNHFSCYIKRYSRADLEILSGCGEGGPSLCRKSTWGYPLPKITRTLSPRYVTWIMHKRIMFAYTWRNQWSLLFNGQNWRCAVSVSEDYRPYRHKSRTLFFITPGRWQSKTLILSTNADQNSIETGVSIVIVNTISCDYYPRSSIVKSVFNCRLPCMFNLNTAPALCIRILASGTGFTNSLLDSNDWIYHQARQVCEFWKKNYCVSSGYSTEPSKWDVSFENQNM